MNLSLLLGVSAFAKQEDRGFATARQVPASAEPGFATAGQVSEIAAIDGVDADALAGAFRSLVDELLLGRGGQRADDGAPAATMPVASEADDLAATLEARGETDEADEAGEAAEPDEADEPEWDAAARQPHPEVWLVELEIVNRTAGVRTDAARPTAVNKHIDHTEEASEESDEVDDSLGKLLNVAALTMSEATPVIPAAPQRAPIASDVPSNPTAAEVPVDSDSEQPTEFAASPGAERAASQQSIETTPPARRAAKQAEPDQRTPAPVAAVRVTDAPSASAVDAVEQARTTEVSDSRFRVPGSGSGFKVQSSGVTTPEGVTRNTEPRTLNQNPPFDYRSGRPEQSGGAEPGTRNHEPLPGVGAVTRVSVDVTAEAVPAERSPTLKADAPSGQPAPDVRVGLVTGAANTKPSGDAPDKSRQPESQVTIARPVAADVRTAGTLPMAPAGHELQAAAMAPVSQSAIIVAPAPMNGAALHEDTANQIVHAIRFQLIRGGGEATIRLEPKHFGELSITVRVEQGQVTARLQAESPVVREYLRSHQGLLRESLADQQLTLGKFEVAEPPAESRDGERRSAEERAFQENRQPQQRRRQSSADTPFEPFEVVA